MKPARKQDLHRELGPGARLRCPDGHEEYSADAGDYWQLLDDATFPCDICGKACVLVRPITRWVPA